jgi:putative DNA primase/helicase
VSAYAQPASEFVRAMGPVARELLGDPTFETKHELRFRQRGSLAVDLLKGVWHDHEANVGGGVVDFVMVETRTDKAGAVAWLRERKHIEPVATRSGSFNIMSTYDYTDADGVLLYQVCRMEPKDFRQRRPDPEKPGSWLWNTGGTKRVLYRLPEVIAAVKEGRPVFICEGEKAADALCGLGVTATCSPGGANKWRREFADHFSSATVVVLPDNDEPGRLHRDMVVRGLSRWATIATITLPGLPPKGDAYDWIAAGGTKADLKALVAKVFEEVFDEEDLALFTDEGSSGIGVEHIDCGAGRHPSPEPTTKPTILVRAGELDTLATKGEAALCSSDLPIYQRGDVLVRPISKEVSASRGRTTVAAGLTELSTHAVLDLLSQSAHWVRFDKRAKAEIACDPPAAVPSIILSRKGQWKLPPVAGVITTPTLRPDGSLLFEPGYDAATRLFHVADPSLKLGAMPEKPSRSQAEEALGKLKALLTGFPFVTEIDRAVALSGLITPVVRGALSVVPLHAFKASTAGSGKSFLVDIISAIATGRPCPVVAAGQTDEETEKRLVGLLIAGFPIVSVDNVNGELGGDLLCQLIERPLIRVRPLGRSEIMELESRATVFATGNGLRVRGDMVRRSLISSLDAQMERPELRKFDTDPVNDVLSDRGKYVAACLTIVRAYAAASRPHHLPALASFEDWSASVRSALVWLGCQDPVTSMESAREDDPDLAELREVLALWKTHLGSGSGYAFTARDAAEAACKREATVMGEPPDFACPEFRDVLLRIAGERGNVNTRKLGTWLMDHAGRIIGGLRMIKAGTANGGVLRWNVEVVK